MTATAAGMRWRSVKLMEDHWRILHGALLELCRLWEAGAALEGAEPGRREDVENIMQKILPILAQASSWPEVAEFEADTRQLLGLPVPEEVLEIARVLVEDWVEEGD